MVIYVQEFFYGRAGLRHMKIDRVKKFEYCLPCEFKFIFYVLITRVLDAFVDFFAYYLLDPTDTAFWALKFMVKQWCYQQVSRCYVTVQEPGPTIVWYAMFFFFLFFYSTFKGVGVLNISFFPLWLFFLS